MNDLTDLSDRVSILEEQLFMLLSNNTSGSDNNKSSDKEIQSIFEKRVVANELLEAINAYRSSLLLGPRNLKFCLISEVNDFQRKSNFAIATKWQLGIALEIETLKNELLWMRRLYRVARPIMFMRRFFWSFKASFKPKLGRLYHHAPIPLQKWGLPRVVRDDRAVAPTISIVTPSFQQGGFIGRTIDSVLNQNYRNIEYFVQDGGSSDQTVSVLESYSEKLSGWVSKKDSGQSQAINRAFQKTTGDIMAWLNSDDLLMPGTLACVAKFFVDHPEVDVVYGHRILIDEQDREIGRWILPKHNDGVLSWADFVPQETLFWRRSIWDKTGACVDESFRFAMDWDLLIRFRNAGARMVRLPFFLGAFRIHEAQKTSATINSVGMMEMDKLRERCLGRKPNHIDIKSAITPYIFWHMVEDFCVRLKRAVGLL